MVITENQVREKLKAVKDPELFINIVDLGLIYEIRIQKSEFSSQKTIIRNKKQPETRNSKLETGVKVFVRMTLTSPGCPLASTFERLVTKAVKKLPGVEEVKIELAWKPPWNQGMMSEEAKAELGMF